MKRLVAGSLVAAALMAAQGSYLNESYAAEANPIIQTASLSSLSGTNVNPRWLDDHRLLVTNENDEVVDYIVDLQAKTHAVFIPGVANLTVSPNGTKAAYINENSEVILVDMNTIVEKKLSEDKNFKTDLQWADDETLIFISGDKSDKIVKLNVSDGKLTDVVADKVEYKQDLRVSKDGKRILYSVTKDGVVKLDGKQEVANVDTSNAVTQLYFFDTTATEAKPVKLTNTPDNKVFADFLPDGRVVYVSADTDENNPAILMAVQTNGKGMENLVTRINVDQAVVTADGRLLILAGTGDERGIYEVDPAQYRRSLLSKVDENTSGFQVSQHGIIAVTIDTENGVKIALFNQGRFEDITQ
jgi:Tol biopolymer transport system component